MSDTKAELDDALDDIHDPGPDPDDPRPRLTKAERKLHDDNVAQIRRMLISFTIFKIGLVALIAVVLWRFFGDGAG